MSDVVSLTLAALQADIDARASGITIEWKSGQQAAMDDGTPTRIVWVPMQDTWLPADQAGSEEDESRVLAVCANGVRAYVWADSDEAARLLRNLLVAALYRAATTRGNGVQSTWASDELRNFASGSQVMVDFAVREHVLDDAPTTATPTTFEEEEPEVDDP